jgi:hypothetical protein
MLHYIHVVTIIVDILKHFSFAFIMHFTERACRKNRKVPSGTEIQYVFFQNNLVKVKVTPSMQECTQCSGEYYFFNGELIFKNEQYYTQRANNFINEAAFFLKRLEIKNRWRNSPTLVYRDLKRLDFSIYEISASFFLFHALFYFFSVHCSPFTQ